MAVINNKNVINKDGLTKKQQMKSYVMNKGCPAAALKPNGTSTLLLLCRDHEGKPSVTEAILWMLEK